MKRPQRKPIDPRPLSPLERSWIQEILEHNPRWADVDLSNTRIVAVCDCDQCKSVYLDSPAPQNPSLAGTLGYIGRIERVATTRFWCRGFFGGAGMLRCRRVACPSPASFGSNLFCLGQPSPRSGAPFGVGIRSAGGGNRGVAAETPFFVFRVRADAGPLARADLADLSPHDFPCDPGCQMDFGALPESQTSHRWAGLATPILGSLRPPRAGVPREAGLYALEPRAERVRQSTAGLAVVEL